MVSGMDTSQTYLLHDLRIVFSVTDHLAAQRLAKQWQPFRAVHASNIASIYFSLNFSDKPPAYPQMPLISDGEHVAHYRQGDRLVSVFHGWGRFELDLAEGFITGVMRRAAIQRYGVFEDMILLAMTPLLRRRGYFPIHAFAAAVGERALVLLGDIGAGKTTTGISLLARGARLIANDSPLVRLVEDIPILHAYPGLLSAYPDSIRRFPQLLHLLIHGEILDGSEKISFPPDAILADPWAQWGRPALLLFPRISPDLRRSRVVPMARFEALKRLVAQSIEDWDVETIPTHMYYLRRLVESAPAYELLLAPDISDLPDLLLALL